MLNHRRVVSAVAVGLGAVASSLGAVELTQDSFVQTHQLILPQKHESKWLQIPWLTDIREARERAAETGTPILIWSGGGAPPIGGC